MNIIEAQAKKFSVEMYLADSNIEIDEIKKRLDNKLSLFKKEKDKLDFLKTLIYESRIEIKNHIIECDTPNCTYEDLVNGGIFLMEQEIDYINETYIFSPKSDDQFSVEEETSLHNKLNEILDRLNKQGLGQEILFDEIESLKNHFNLGKKTWLQLALGKIFSVTGDKMIEESVSKEIISQITEMFHDSIKLIP